jgi:hypothetical protein
MSHPPELYQIIYGDNASSLYTFGVPDAGHEAVQARTVYRSLAEAKRALQTLVKKFDRFVPVAYGQAYPYEHVTFDHELAKSGFAVYGWATIHDESADSEDGERFAVGLLRLTVV